MSAPLRPCLSCRRFLRATEPRCPFCSAANRIAPLLLLGTLVVAGHAAAHGAPSARPLPREVAVQGAGPSSFIAQYGAPPPRPEPPPNGAPDGRPVVQPPPPPPPPPATNSRLRPARRRGATPVPPAAVAEYGIAPH